MPDIFLSYSRTDLAIAGQLAGVLQAAGHDVWWDQALKAGEVYDRVTEAALREARVVVVLWSKAAVASDWVRSEATVAMQRGALMPVMIEDCQRPVMFELRQSADLIGWKGNAKDLRLAAFVADVTRQLAGPVTAAPVAQAAAAAAGPSRRGLIGGAVGAVALAAGGFGAWKFMGGKVPDKGTASIAVMPFANLSGDPAQAYFSDGIAEELRSALATIAGLKVAARTSSELMRDTDIKEAATKLGVAHVLTGSVRRGGGKIRVTAQLLDGETGLESWSQAYDRPAGDVLEVQTGIAGSVATALSLQFGKAAALVGGTRNPTAYDAYLRSTANQLGGDAGYRAALADIDAAVAADPEFALAHGFRALVMVNMANNAAQGEAGSVTLDDSIAAANRAIALKPDLRVAHSVIGRARQLKLDFKGAETAFAKAATLPFGTGRGIILESLFQSEMGRSAAALAIADRAVAFDPLSRVPMRNRLRILMDDRKGEAALSAYEAWNRANPDNLIATSYHIRALLLLKRPREALVVARRYEDEVGKLSLVARAEAMLGNRTASDAALRGLQAIRGRATPFRIAGIRALQGEMELAFAELERAVDERDLQLTRLRVDDAFDSLRGNPRYAALEKRLGFPTL
ncbi:TIR domain-containing protein [Sandarakinorhabdus sp. AAP62]|uniref:TIR domain-containing protein n=1 Tax=Sandarakinorhabdus sp. AAP62 TaxID=1248916 RepID=UPI0003110874|nr:TIR domain-containing protein [Sandarakinorhabdus sp. AAP62]